MHRVWSELVQGGEAFHKELLTNGIQHSRGSDGLLILLLASFQNNCASLNSWLISIRDTKRPFLFSDRKHPHGLNGLV